MIVITGATKGIGRALVEVFAQKGRCNLAICARDQAALEAVKAEVEEQHLVEVHIRATDVSNATEVRAFADFVLALGEPVAALINNAGVFIPGEVCTEEAGRLETMIATNLYSAYHLTRALVPAMREQGSGDIFNICSIASTIAYPNGGSYSITKFALYGMSKVLREELKPAGIRVISVLPGATYTASWENAPVEETRLMPAEDIATAVFAAFSMSRRTVIEDIVLRPQLGDL
ncbi:MAG: SDR family oxidoreductase [Bernardetiaceae bacterium]